MNPIDSIGQLAGDGKTAPSAARSILIVEDDPVVALNLTDILANTGYRVVSASATIMSARAAMQDYQIDAALLDIKLDGETLVFPLAELLIALRIPFGFVSGYPRRQLVMHLRSRPFLTKPYSQTDVIQLIKQLLAGS